LPADDISAFVVIFRDETELLAQQNEAKIAKKQSRTLLFQILPRDIARLNAGEKDTSFSIESATVMFIDIVKFSEYAANLPPQKIIGNLSQIFARFDEACAKYPLLIESHLLATYRCVRVGFSRQIHRRLHM
jgi:class 3 adenylate cyclase